MKPPRRSPRFPSRTLFSRPLANATLRTRLTFHYGSIFAIAGVALVTILYFVTAAMLDNEPTNPVRIALNNNANNQAAGSHYIVPIQDDTYLADVVDIDSGQFAPLTRMYTFPGSVEPDPVTSAEYLDFEVNRITAQARADTLRSVLWWSIAALAVTLVGAVGVGWLMASRVLAPLKTVTAAARTVGDTNLHERIALDGPCDEIKDLADTFDGMLERLDRAFDGQRRFTANASHELRTPITITRTVLEVTADDPDATESMRELSQTLLKVNARQERLIDSLLALATADQALPSLEPIDLRCVARQIRDDVAPHAAAVRVRIDLDAQGAYPPGTDPHIVYGSEVLVERLVRNLVDNAVRYNVDGGQVWVRLPEPGVLIVENTGPLVPDDQVEGLFDAFRRLTPEGAIADRKGGSHEHGVGLGLSIVRSIAAAHHGHVSASARRGGGLTVRVEFGDAPA